MTAKPVREDDVLEAAVQALRQAAAATSPPDDLLARIAAAGPASDVTHPRLFWPSLRRSPLRPLLSCAAAAVLFLLLWQATDRLNIFRPSLAFAEVTERVRQTHSVFFRCTVTVEGQKRFVMNYTLAEPGFMRIHASAPANTILTFDETRSAGLLLLTEQKKAIALTAAADMPKETASVIAWYRSLRQAQDQAVDDLGPRQLGDRATFGFRVKKAEQEFDVWVDRKTALPVQVETSMSVQGLKTRATLDQFAFDAELPSGLFSLTPPPGYTVEAKTELAQPAEKDLIHLLRLTATQNGGVFPDDLNIKTLQQVFTKKPEPRTRLDEPVFAATLKFTNGLLFLHQRQTEGDWRYQGKGVKLGDATKLVYAWRKSGDRDYRAVFGDLQIRNVPAAEVSGKQD